MTFSLVPKNTNLMYLSLQVKLSNQAKTAWKYYYYFPQYSQMIYIFLLHMEIIFTARNEVGARLCFYTCV